MDWLEPWDKSDETQLVDELSREMCIEHILWNLPLYIIGRRADCDDVLFGLNDGSGRVAVVHLTYRRESSPQWPKVEMFSNISDFASMRMKPDHEDFDI